MTSPIDETIYSQNSQSGKKQRGPYKLKNATMEVLGYTDDSSMKIQLKFILKNGAEKFFSKYLLAEHQ